MRTLILIVLLFMPILMISGLGCAKTKETGKELYDQVDDVVSISESKKKQSLLEARENVKLSKRKLDECLKRASGDESRCTKEREKYDRDTDIYISIQQGGKSK